MQGDERHSLKYQNNCIYPKRKDAAAVIGLSWHGLKCKWMAAVNSKVRQPRKKGTNQRKEMKGTAYNIKINSIYPMRKNAATVICMSWHGLKRKCMAAVIRKSKQPINKRQGTMQGDQRPSFKSQNSQHLPKKEIHGCYYWHVTARPK